MSVATGMRWRWVFASRPDFAGLLPWNSIEDKTFDAFKLIVIEISERVDCMDRISLWNYRSVCLCGGRDIIVHYLSTSTNQGRRGSGRVRDGRASLVTFYLVRSAEKSYDRHLDAQSRLLSLFRNVQARIEALFFPAPNEIRRTSAGWALFLRYFSILSQLLSRDTRDVHQRNL